LEFTDHGILGIFIDSRLILDVFGTRSITKGRQGFLHIIVSRTDVGNHNGFCVTSERILKESSELGITIGHKSALRVGQATNNVAKSRKRQVNLNTLLHAFTFSFGLALTL
jgi:hypothetical protein